MEKITIKSKDITIEFDYKKLCEIIVEWPVEDRVKFIEYVLNCHNSNENILNELAKSQYNKCIKNAISFDEMSRDPILNCSTYKFVSDDYQKKAECWKTFLDL